MVTFTLSVKCALYAGSGDASEAAATLGPVAPVPGCHSYGGFQSQDE